MRGYRFHLGDTMIVFQEYPRLWVTIALPWPSFHRERGRNSYYRYIWWLCSDGYSYSDSECTQTTTIDSNGYALELCQWLGGSQVYFLSPEFVHKIIWFMFRTYDLGTYRLRRGSTAEIGIMEVVTPWSLCIYIITYLFLKKKCQKDEIINLAYACPLWIPLWHNFRQ